MPGGGKDVALRRHRHGLLRGDVQMLAASRLHTALVGDHRRGRGLGAGVQVRLRYTDAQRRAVGVAGEREHRGRRHDHDVGDEPVRLRPVQPEGRGRDHDQARIRGCKPLIAQPQRLHARHADRIARPLPFEHEIGLGGEPAELRLASRCCEVERNAALVAVVGPPGQAAVGVRHVLIERRATAQLSAAGWLDDHHIGAEIAKDLAADGRAEAGNLQHTQVFEHERLRPEKAVANRQLAVGNRRLSAALARFRTLNTRIAEATPGYPSFCGKLALGQAWRA